MNEYLDLINKYPNKYDLTPKKIRHLKILNWDKLKENTWHNNAMLSGNWWCHIEGCGLNKENYDNEFWIGFNEENNVIRFNFTSHDGMCSYVFKKFYNSRYINNRNDMIVQINAIKWLNMMIEKNILGVE